MKNFVIAPDSFKGTMDAKDVCRVIAGSIRKYIPDAEIKSIPLADGGEGMVESYIQLLGGKKISAVVSDPFGRPIEVTYGLLSDGSAVMEMASCAGLTLTEGEKDTLHASTFGVGEMLLDAHGKGIKNILIGIGGSATNDCGLGMASALGYRFYGDDGRPVEPFACNLGLISKIERPGSLPDIRVVAACDVTNPLCGPHGATYVFGKQKGIDEALFEKIDAHMASFADVIEKDMGVAVKDMPGAGAAGGMGAAMAAFLGAELKSGIDLILDAIDFDSIIAGADLVITGEGRIDGQSATGKVPVGVGLRAKKASVPCIALCGAVGPNAELVYDYGITAVYSSVKDAADFEEIRKNCYQNLESLADSVVKTLLI